MNDDNLIEMLWQRARPRAAARIEVIAQAADCGEAPHPLSREAAWQEAHRLAGSLGTFGFEEAGEAAAEAERILDPSAETIDWDQLQQAIERMREAVRA